MSRVAGLRHGPRARVASAVPVPVVLDLLAAATRTGAPVPRALAATGAAVGGVHGAALERVAAALGWGASWDEAWQAAPAELLVAADVLRSGWEHGAPVAARLDGAARRLRRARHAAAAEAAGRLGVRLLLPLGLCHLPAFVAVGLVPVLLALVTGTLGA
jgi:pilus assembly protein TadC